MVCKNLCFAYVRKVFLNFSAEHLLSHDMQKFIFAYVRQVFLVFSPEHLLSHDMQKSSFCLCTQGCSSFFSRASAQPWCANI